MSLAQSMRRLAGMLWRRGAETLAGATFIIILLIALFQVFRRYVLQDPSIWTEEVARMLLVWATFLAAAAATRTGDHLYVDTLLLRLPPRARHLAQSLINVLVAGIGACFVWYGWPLYEMNANNTSTSLGFARSLFYAPALVGGAGIAVYALAQAIHHLRCGLQLPGDSLRCS